MTVVGDRSFPMLGLNARSMHLEFLFYFYCDVRNFCCILYLAMVWMYLAMKCGMRKFEFKLKDILLSWIWILDI